MTDFKDTVLVAHVRETTNSAKGSAPGTIVAVKRGDWVWVALSAILVGGVVYTLLNPSVLRQLFA